MAIDLNNDLVANLAKGTVLPNIPLLPGLLGNVPQILIQGAANGLIREEIVSYAIKNTKQLATIIGEVSNLDALGVTKNSRFDNPYNLDRRTNISELGSYLFDNLELVGQTFEIYESIETDGIISSVAKAYVFPGITLNSAIITVDKVNNIVETITVGTKDSSFKEFVGNGEYSINIDCYITAENLGNGRFEYNVPALKAIKRLLAIKNSINIRSFFLSLFDISQIIIKNIKIEQVEGFGGVVKMTIQAISHTKNFNL